MIYSAINFFNSNEDDIDEAIINTREECMKLPNVGQYKILVVDVEPVRDLSQNKYYWLILKIISEYTGHDIYELHRIFGRMFNVEIVENQHFDVIVTKGSTTAIKKKAFWDYCRKIRLFSLNFMGVPQEHWDIVLPDQNQVTEELLWRVGIHQ